jgi:hypothetical protein
MTLPRHLVAAASALLLLSAAPGGLVTATDPSATTPAAASTTSSPADTTAGAAITEADAVALVLATDPRFAALPDFDSVRRQAARAFKPLTLTTSYVRPLGGRRVLLEEMELQPKTPAGYLIEVMLVLDCVEPTLAPGLDPCGWWHSWYYRVAPDGTLELLYEEGLPDEAA